MRLLTYSIGLLLLSILFAACNSADSKVASQAQPKPVATGTPYSDGARRVTIEELESLTKEGRAVVVDVRSQDAYNAGHIPGAKLIPLEDIGTRYKELPREKLIITYCSWTNEQTSARAVVALKNKGIDNAAALLGGYNLWQQKGKPIEKK